MRITLIILIFLFFNFVNAQECLDSNEILKILNNFEDEVTTLIPENSHPILFSYSDYNLDITGYSDFNDPKNILIKLVGPHCGDKMYADEIKLLLCHELGHVLGGAPFMHFQGASPDLEVSAEGQADYYATNICFPQLLKTETNEEFANKIFEYPELHVLCENKDPEEFGYCIRTAIASLNFTTYIYQQIKSQTDFIPPKSAGLQPHFLIHDSKVVSKTLGREYPSPLCRLDTLIAGLLNKERPSCWYRAEN